MKQTPVQAAPPPAAPRSNLRGWRQRTAVADLDPDAGLMVDEKGNRNAKVKECPAASLPW
jgi:hypothetical protein